MIAVLVTGSRTYPPDADSQYQIYRRLAALRKLSPDDALLLHGGAQGADRLAARIGRDLGYEIQEFTPDWEKGPFSSTGKNLAGIRRNELMGLVLGAHEQQGYLTFVEGFVDRRITPGTHHMLTFAKEHDFTVHVQNENGQTLAF